MISVITGLGLLVASLAAIGWLARTKRDPVARFLTTGDVLGAMTCVLITFAFFSSLLMLGVGVHEWLDSVTQDVGIVLAVLIVALVTMFRITRARRV